VARAESILTTEASQIARANDLDKKSMQEHKRQDRQATVKEQLVLASAVIDARKRAGLTQAELAKKMGTAQPVVARLESGRARPSIRTLERLAEATGSRLLISFEMRGAKVN
jgi:ribosome-binding protein aMBF1 (putative translation factor)